jgi:RimJ/RimL family protein N-acetyltransferase
VSRRLAAGSVDEQSPPTRPRAWARPVDLSDGVIRLEPLASRHVPDFELLVDDPDVIRFTRVPTDPSEGFVAAWLGGYERGWDDESKAGFAVVGAESGEFLGFVGLIRFDWDAQESEIGYVIAPAARGGGIAGRAIELTSRWDSTSSASSGSRRGSTSRTRRH